ncbi:MAG: thymidylate synthase (FAD), intein-containing [Acaryochloris sp. RU_4_1]|nr:thymidylate synthase (FAD), intein-containing [Acaryochloris sp. RU_4_1]NJR55478.1 thymidylate synthase (FAD), intein-containing [Acaryochloris sp. CRU_2_0]
MDERFTVEVISQTPNPQQITYAAMHQDYAEAFVWADRDQWPDEQKCGELIVKNLLQGNRGHYGPLEHPQIVLNFGYFPHSTMQQMRTHRNVSFDVQCLAADTEITFVDAKGRTNRTLKKTIGQLYELWTNGETALRERRIRGRNGEAPGMYHRDCQKRLQKMRLRVLNEDTGRFEIGHIKDVICSGIQPVYRLTLANGKTLDCTVNHRLYTALGWQTMGEAVGLITDAKGEVTKLTKECELMCNGLAVADVSLAYEFDNLVSLCQPCHDYIHHHHLELEFAQTYQRIEPLPEWKAKPKALIAHPVSVINVEYLGLQMTYDLEVEEPWHNFVANGIVVHNSFRYTGQRILDVVAGKQDLEDVFYLRPVSTYSDRQGKKYEYTLEQRQQDWEWCQQACHRYAERIQEGLAEEHARGLIPFDVRQHWVMSANARSLMHLLDIRGKYDVQLETREMTELMFTQFQQWMPEVAHWYAKTRWRKGPLAP